MSDPVLTGLGAASAGASRGSSQEPRYQIVRCGTPFGVPARLRPPDGQAVMHRDEYATIDPQDPFWAAKLTAGYLELLPDTEQPIPFVRQFGPGATGTDCRAVKRGLLVIAPHLVGKPKTPNYGLNPKTNAFGKPAQALLADTKQALGLLADPIYTAQAHTLFQQHGAYDAFDRALFAEEQEALTRELFLQIARLTVAHTGLFGYSEAIGEEPGDRDWWRVAPAAPDGSNWQALVNEHGKFTSDCSAHFIGCGEHAGIPSTVASGVMDSDAATALLLADLTTITLKDARPGDCVIWTGPAYPGGSHLTILNAKQPGGDWQTINNGGPTGTGPIYSTLSEQQAIQAGLGSPTQNVRRLPA